MAFIPVADAAQAIVAFQHNDQDWTFGLWFTQASFGVTEQETLAIALDGWVHSSLKTHISQDADYLGVTVYDQRSSSAPVVIENANAGACTGAVDILPLNTALVLTFYTAARGRTARGRCYFAGVSEGNFTDGAFTAGIAAALESAFGAMHTSVLSQNWTPVVVSKYENGLPRAAGLARAITDVQCRSVRPGTQRRRIDRT